MEREEKSMQAEYTKSKDQVNPPAQKNLLRVARVLAECKHKERIIKALTALLEPSVEQADPMRQEGRVSIADVLSRLDVSELD